MIIPPVTPEYDTSAQAILNEVLTKSDGQNLKLDQDNFLTTGSICLQDSVGDWYKIGIGLGGINSLTDTTPTTTGLWQDVAYQESDWWTNISQTSTSGSGTGSLYTIQVIQETYLGTIIVTNSGSGYAVNDTIVIEDPGSTSYTTTITVDSIKEGRLIVTKLAGTQIDADGRPSIASTNPYS